jgi:hypothetical protein
MPDPLDALRFLLGEWVGRASGAAGAGAVRRSYARVLGDRFIEFRHQSEYAPQDANPEGEVHEEMGLFYHDGSRIVLREFHAEGFVITYRMWADGGLVFVSETFENGPPGIRARMTLHPEGHDRMEEVFELAPSGEDFSEFIRNSWKRVG